MSRVSDADLRLLRIFATVVDCKGFAAAQADLNLSAPSISSYIAALEQRLGVRLCSRGRSGFALTDKGALIYREAQRLFGAVEEFTASAGAVRGRLTGNLRIGVVDCTVSDPASPLGNALRRFNERDHEVRIELTIQAPQDLQRGVLDGRLNLAIGSFPVRIAALNSQALHHERNAFYCGAGHPLFCRETVTLDDIRAHRVVARGYWRRADLSRIGIEREAASVDNMEAQAILILSGAYLGYLPEHYAADWWAQGLVRSLLPEELAYEALFALITRRGSAPVAVVRQFVDDLILSLPGSHARSKHDKELRSTTPRGATVGSPRGVTADSPALEPQP
ncbi:MAG: LysR family transcriptional regulator [Geminicoccaceae bacterium]|nr:LysR family transcriptional regulator [Geminicoccaceae bacterium]